MRSLITAALFLVFSIFAACASQSTKNVANDLPPGWGTFKGYAK